MDYITLNGKRYPVSDFRLVAKPRTNADRIRSMTDEELATFLFQSRIDKLSEKEWLEWLKQESKK